MSWQVYIIACSDDTFYTGISTDTQRRFSEHASGLGAKYFRGRRPIKIVYRESNHTRSSASSREREIKALARAKKYILISSETNEIYDYQEAGEPPSQPVRRLRA